MAEQEQAAQGAAVPEAAATVASPGAMPPGAFPRGAMPRGMPVSAEEETEKKKKKKFKGKAVLLIILAVAIGVLFAAYYFNFMNLKTRVISFFESQDPDFMRTVQEYEQQRALYEEQQAELTAQAQSLAQREQAIAERESELASQESGGGSLGGAGSVGEVAKVFEAMDRNAAAEIFNNTVNTAWIANVLLQVNETKAAQILGAMEPGKAALVASLMSG